MEKRITLNLIRTDFAFLVINLTIFEFPLNLNFWGVEQSPDINWGSTECTLSQLPPMRSPPVDPKGGNPAMQVESMSIRQSRLKKNKKFFESEM